MATPPHRTMLHVLAAAVFALVMQAAAHLGEHPAHTSVSHPGQWCRRLNSENAALQTVHTADVPSGIHLTIIGATSGVTVSGKGLGGWEGRHPTPLYRSALTIFSHGSTANRRDTFFPPRIDAAAGLTQRSKCRVNRTKPNRVFQPRPLPE
jgi:hypothetical protein